jgi:hypothetical protein
MNLVEKLFKEKIYGGDIDAWRFNCDRFNSWFIREIAW